MLNEPPASRVLHRALSSAHIRSTYDSRATKVSSPQTPNSKTPRFWSPESCTVVQILPTIPWPNNTPSMAIMLTVLPMIPVSPTPRSILAMELVNDGPSTLKVCITGFAIFVSIGSPYRWTRTVKPCSNTFSPLVCKNEEIVVLAQGFEILNFPAKLCAQGCMTAIRSADSGAAGRLPQHISNRVRRW